MINIDFEIDIKPSTVRSVPFIIFALRKGIDIVWFTEEVKSLSEALLDEILIEYNV